MEYFFDASHVCCTIFFAIYRINSFQSVYDLSQTFCPVLFILCCIRVKSKECFGMTERIFKQKIVLFCSQWNCDGIDVGQIYSE